MNLGRSTTSLSTNSMTAKSFTRWPSPTWQTVHLTNITQWLLRPHCWPEVYRQKPMMLLFCYFFALDFANLTFSSYLTSHSLLSHLYRLWYSDRREVCLGFVPEVTGEENTILTLPAYLKHFLTLICKPLLHHIHYVTQMQWHHGDTQYCYKRCNNIVIYSMDSTKLKPIVFIV